MKHENESPKDNTMDDIGRLIRHAGGREPVPVDRFDRARARVEAHWRDVTGRPRQRRFARPIRTVALAAAVVAAIAVGLLVRGGGGPAPATLATIERVTGTVSVDGLRAESGVGLAGGTRLETRGDGRIAVRLVGGQSLRLDVDTSATLIAGNLVDLDTGALYVDSDAAPEGAAVSIRTAFGVARDIGTQFQVRIDANRLQVGVRTGQVELLRDDNAPVTVDTGRFVDVDADGSTREWHVQPDDPAWRWAETVVPAMELDGASLADYLAWYSGERGLRLAWAHPGAATRAAGIRLSASLDGLTLDEGFELVRTIATFDYRLEDGTLWITVE